ncbi:MAG: HigA family addiction module antitoxin [Elusimicrobiota bacterium]
MKLRKRSPVHPGEIIKRHYLEPLSIGVMEASDALGVSRKTLSKILNGRGSVTADMALRLSKAFVTTPQLWLNLQKNYDLWHASHHSRAWMKVHQIAA